MANYFCTDSVEEQVDYLTDKVKDLNTKKLDKAAVVQATGTGTDVVMSQKAVTDVINENLQTINTEVNGKLTKPTNPSAESAVTLLADGTVGTKLLSEIGGGGGKLYSYYYTLNLDKYNDSTTPPPFFLTLQFYLTYMTKIDTYEKLRTICGKIYGNNGSIPVVFNKFGVNTKYSGTLKFYKKEEDNYVRFYFGGITTNVEGSIEALQYYDDINCLRPWKMNGLYQWSDSVSPIVTEL